MESNTESKRSMVFLTVGAFFVLAVVVGGYFYMKSKDSDATKDAAGKSAQQAKVPVVDGLASVKFVSPAKLAGYIERANSTATNRVYVTSDGTCELDFGTTTPELLKGSDIGSVVANLLQLYRNNGAAITGPTPGAALVLKDKQGASYSLPTLVFSLKKTGDEILSHYSLSILKDGTRVYVTRLCTNQVSSVDPAAVDRVDATARQLTIEH